MMQEIIPYTTWTHFALIYPFSFPLDMQIGLQHARSRAERERVSFKNFFE